MILTIKNIIKKLLLGKVSLAEHSGKDPIQKRIQNIKSIWENDHQEDNGIEKIVRLFLSSSQLLFPGIYLKHLANKKGHEYQDLITDLYVILKVVFPFVILINGWQENIFIRGFIIYILTETVLYIPTLIFASDSFEKPRSYKRSMLLLFFNYAEIILTFAVLYASTHCLNKPFHHWFDAVYFSMITSSSIGYGDFYPVTTIGKVLVSAQASLFLFFVVLFLNFFSAKVKNKGYFDN